MNPVDLALIALQALGALVELVTERPTPKPVVTPEPPAIERPAEPVEGRP